MDQPLQILALFDQTSLLQDFLQLLYNDGYKIKHTQVTDLDGLQAELAKESWNCVFMEYNPHQLSTLTKIKRTWQNLPIVVLSEIPNEDQIVLAIKAGADDYISLQNPSRLHRILRFSQVGRGPQIPVINFSSPASTDPEALLIQRNRELALLNGLGQVFVSTLDLDQVLSTVLEEIRRLLGVVACSVWLVDPESDELVCRQATEPQVEKVRGWRVAPGVGLVGWVVEHGKSLVVSDTNDDERHYKEVDAETGLPLRSILSAPLQVKNNVIGVLQVVDAAVARFDWSDLFLLESLAATTAIAIENMRLYEQAHKDAETKARLLREANHRVKNNLSAIIGLLYAQLRDANIADEHSYRTQIKEIVSRVQGLATVHSLLSASEWSPILLSELVTQIAHSSLQALPMDRRIKINIPTSTILVDPKQANSLAIVVNELVTNTVKYAFPAQEDGQINIDAAIERDQYQREVVCFQYHDTGIGYPENVLSLEHFNVGLYLMKTIIRKDLGGELRLKNNEGALAMIRFPVATQAKSDSNNDHPNLSI
ncbi:MAG: GAF domain-containing protein [Chloroflexota bacterium]